MVSFFLTLSKANRDLRITDTKGHCCDFSFWKGLFFRGELLVSGWVVVGI